MMSNWCKKGVSMIFNCCLISERIICAKYLFAWDMRYAWSHFLRAFLDTKRLQDHKGQRATTDAYDTLNVASGSTCNKHDSQKQII